VFEFNPDNFQLEDLDRIFGQTQELMKNLEQVQDALADITGEGEAADGLIRAVVDGSGGIREVALNPRAMRLDSATLAEALTRAVREAQSDAKSKTAQLLGGAGADLDLDLEPPDQDQLRETLQGIEDSFSQKIDARTDEILRRFES
jgi:DNA-binding protein YbaB